MEAVKKAIQLLRSVLLRLLKKIKTKIKLKTYAILSAISISRKATIPTNISKSQKTIDGLGNFYVND